MQIFPSPKNSIMRGPGVGCVDMLFFSSQFTELPEILAQDRPYARQKAQTNVDHLKAYCPDMYCEF